MEPETPWASRKTLNNLVIAQLIVGLLYILLSYLRLPQLPDSLRAWQEFRTQAGITPQDWISFALGVFVLGTHLVAAFGVLTLWRPARGLFLVSSVATLPVTLLNGPYVASALATTLDELALLLSGLIVGLLSASPLRLLFEREGAPRVAVAAAP